MKWHRNGPDHPPPPTPSYAQPKRPHSTSQTSLLKSWSNSCHAEFAEEIRPQPKSSPQPKIPQVQSRSVNSVKQLRTQTPPKIPRTDSLVVMKTASLTQQEDENLDGSFPILFSWVNSVDLTLIHWSRRSSVAVFNSLALSLCTMHLNDLLPRNTLKHQNLVKVWNLHTLRIFS